MNIAFFQSKSLSCNALMSEPNSVVVAQSGGCTAIKTHCFLSRVGCLINIPLPVPVTHIPPH